MLGTWACTELVPGRGRGVGVVVVKTKYFFKRGQDQIIFYLSIQNKLLNQPIYLQVWNSKSKCPSPSSDLPVYAHGLEGNG